MKKIEAIIRTSKFHAVKEALVKEGIEFFTFYDLKASGHQKESFRGNEYDIGYIARTKLEIVVSSEAFCDAAIQAILKNAKTGEVGDGKIYVYDIAKAYRVRDGLEGMEAINFEK
ncbi:MAG: P-II family nitrogen regulator [Cytophagales bacterium]